MKRLIRYLANITGVSNDIRNETVSDIGGRLINASFWFGENPKYKLLLYKYGAHMKEYSNMPDVSEVRKDLFPQEPTIKL